ncbi:MAG: hypothetical protein HY645_09885 [Acidobacteria bacterium]|nr:hypothetical protein [Acidobacteriota bacterium]
MATLGSREQLQEQEKRLREQIEKKHGKTPEQLHEEREKRILDVVELRVPDRVPVTVGAGVFAAKYAGLTSSAQYYNHAAFREACLKMMLEFEPDIGQAQGGNPGLVLEMLDAKDQRWPGGALPDDAPYQFVEGEYMTPDEYDLLLKDTSDFIVRYYLPRIYGALAPFSKLPPFTTFMAAQGYGSLLTIFSKPEFRKVAELLAKASEEQDRVRKEGAEFAGLMRRLGFPSMERNASAGGAPFDLISDRLRGMRGAMLDMYRCPDKLLAACDRILEWRIAQAVPADSTRGGKVKIGGGALHRGSDGFMSLKQFEKFYWPGLKKATFASIEMGYTVSHFFEGVWDQRLEYLLELPKGKLIFHTEKTDLFRAKEILGGHMCIQGGVPPTLLEVGTPQEVEEHCKKMIQVVGKNGGLILGPGSSIDYAKPANLKAMVDSVKKYGWY